MTKTIALLIDDSEKTERLLPLLTQRLAEIICPINDVRIELVYLYSDIKKSILDLPLGCIVNTCYCLQINQNRTDIQKLSRIAYGLFQGKQIEAIISGNSPVCKECMAGLAYLFDTGLAADCNGLTIDASNGRFCFERIVGDFPPKSAVVKIENSIPQMATFVDVQINGVNNTVIVDKDNVIVEVPHNCTEIDKNTGNDYLEDKIFPQHKVFFVIGAGVISFEIAERLRLFAENNGIGFGITRQILNRGWYDASFLIGISGKKITPNVCVAFGVSGAYQSYIGMKDSRYIVSINNDVSAPMVNYSHKTIVADVNDVIKELTITL